MTSCRLLVLPALVLLCALVITEGMRYNNSAKTCCYSFTTKQLKRSMVRSYSWTSPQCSNQAILFKTKGGKQVCAKPNDPWVRNLMKLLDSKPIGSQGPV